MTLLTYRSMLSLFAFLPIRPLFRKAGLLGVATALIQAAARKGGLQAGIGTHTWRKTAARRAYEASGHDLLAVIRILGHTSVLTTVDYLSWDLDAKADGLLRPL